MTKEEIITFAEAKGAYVEVKTFSLGYSGETISIFTEPLPVDSTGINSWRHGIFLNQMDRQWTIGYSQFGVTRQLNGTELRVILGTWIENRSDEVFEDYSNT